MSRPEAVNPKAPARRDAGSFFACLLGRFTLCSRSYRSGRIDDDEIECPAVLAQRWPVTRSGAAWTRESPVPTVVETGAAWTNCRSDYAAAAGSCPLGSRRAEARDPGTAHLEGKVIATESCHQESYLAEALRQEARVEFPGRHGSQSFRHWRTRLWK